MALPVIKTYDAIDESIFSQAAELWNITGIGNPARGDSFEAVQKTLEHGGRLVMLYLEDTPIGTVWLTHDHRRLYIHHMAVHPEYQNKGYGRPLMDTAINYAVSLKLQAKLEVKADNLPANKLYSHYEFEALDGYRLLIRRKVD